MGAGIFRFGVLLGFMSVQVYLVETSTIFAASAMASNTVVRSLLGAILPLVPQRLYDDLGYGWGNSLLGFIAVAFIPAPVFLLKYGAAIRPNPRFQVRLWGMGGCVVLLLILCAVHDLGEMECLSSLAYNHYMSAGVTIKQGDVDQQKHDGIAPGL